MEKKPNRQRDWHKQVFLLHKQAKVWQFILFLTIHAQYETNSILDTAPGGAFAPPLFREDKRKVLRVGKIRQS